MKTKISKIMGVGLALLMVFSLAFALVPAQKAQAAEGNMQWAAQPLPTALYIQLASGTNVTEIAVGPDGTTIYAINNTINMNAAAAAPVFQLYKSIDGGMSWAGIDTSGITGAVAAPLGNVAVAPDNPGVVAISTLDAATAAADSAFISTDGGVTWAALPALNGAAARMRITDLKVGPARGGTIYGRDYMVAIGDDGNTAARGGLEIVGETATWTIISNAGALGAIDFVACEFSPNFVGDRIVFGLGNPGAQAAEYTYNVQNYGTGVVPTVVENVPLTANASTDYQLAALAAQDLAGDIAVPTNFDITPGFERVYVSLNTANIAHSGVWRCDGPLAPRELGMVNNQVTAIAYSGDVSNGTLFAGMRVGAGIQTQVWSTAQPTTNVPTWYPSYKPPTGLLAIATGKGGAFVRVSPNFAADKTVYCGTSSAANAESAFSISTDAGLTFNQKAIINSNGANTVVKIDALMLSPDGATVFLATDDGAQLSLWESATAPSPFSWKRIFCFTGANGALAINKATWADSPEVYFAETPTAVNRIFASYDGGNIFNTRSAPVIGAAINFMAVESSKVVFMAIGTNVYKSTNGASVWSPPRPGNVGGIFSVIPCPGGDVAVGGTGGFASLSTDGGVTFVQLPPGLAPTGNYVVIPDEGYAENHYLYAGDVAGANGIYRLQVGTDSQWASLANPTAANLVGIAMNSGALYGMTAAAGADRTLHPHFTVADMAATWATMNAGALPPAAAMFDIGMSKAYAANATTGLWAYNDYYATAKTTITSPASGAVIPVDPVTGRAQTIPFTWTAVGTGTGMGTNYLFWIFEKSQGLPGALIIPTGAMPVPSVPSNSVYPAQVAAAAAPDINYTFLAGTEYGIMISAANEVSGDAVGSALSDPIFISIEASSGVVSQPHAGPILLGPTPGATDVPPDVGFSWAPMAGVTEYELVIATDAALTQPVAGTPVTLSTTAYGPVTLEYSTDYYYAVRATAPTSSVQSIGSFRTMISPEKVAPPVVVEQPQISPAWIWAVVIIGALLVIAVIVLIVRTRRV
jgi:hypothetical protein